MYLGGGSGQSPCTSWISVLCCVFFISPWLQCEAVNINRYHKLKREEFIQLDWDVTNYYSETYEQLDQRNVSYDDHLFRSIRALRHTIVLNQFDYRYTDMDTMRKSAGSRVDKKLCQMQLKALHRMALDRSNGDLSMPLSVSNFLESSGRTEPGVLNGNVVWWGSFSSCSRAKIPASSAARYMEDQAHKSMAIQGRYCVAHLRGKRWPKYDIYFEDRINIRIGLCIPETCHSYLYVESQDMQAKIDNLTRSNLAKPFSEPDRYEVFNLYCLPDEDSLFRQWDLGTWMFASFATAWMLVLIWCNYKYHQRSEAMRKLRNAVDIRMIINQKREPNESSSEEERDQARQKEPSDRNSKRAKAKDPRVSSSLDALNMESLAPPSVSRPSSVNPSPMPSDMEENDGEFKEIRPVVVDTNRRRRSSQRAGGTGARGDAQGGLDFIRAFAIESNLSYLFNTRSNEARARGDTIRQQSSSSGGQQSSNYKRSSQQHLSAVNRRTSSSNEALIKNLKQHEQEQGDLGKSKVAILDSAHSQQSDDRSASGRLVNVDIFDGIKVLATSWIIYGHTLMLFFGLVTDLRFGDERMLDFVMVASINTLQVVGLFYIITGALLTYLAFSRQKIKQLMQPSFWLLVIFGRYIRLIPTYLLVFWFARHVSPYTGSGFFWFDYRTDSEHVRGYCATQSWWTMLTMSAADVKIPLDCVPQAWYLSNDFRTLLILPFYIILMATNRTAGYVAIGSTIIFSHLRLVTILRRANIDYNVLIRWKPHVYSLMADRLHDVYTNLPVRLSTYLLGVVIGHVLYLYETHQIQNIPNWLKNYGTKLALMVGFIFFMGGPLISQFHYLLPSPDDLDSDTLVLLIPVFKTAMEISICIVLLLLAIGGGFKWIVKILDSKAAKVLSNISYGVFLVHVEVMYKMPALKFESSYWYLFIYSTFFTAVSNAIAFLIYILYEMPINNLLRYLFKRMYKAVVK